MRIVKALLALAAGLFSAGKSTEPLAGPYASKRRIYSRPNQGRGRYVPPTASTTPAISLRALQMMRAARRRLSLRTPGTDVYRVLHRGVSS